MINLLIFYQLIEEKLKELLIILNQDLKLKQFWVNMALIRMLKRYFVKNIFILTNYTIKRLSTSKYGNIGYNYNNLTMTFRRKHSPIVYNNMPRFKYSDLIQLCNQILEFFINYVGK